MSARAAVFLVASGAGGTFCSAGGGCPDRVQCHFGGGTVLVGIFEIPIRNAVRHFTYLHADSVWSAGRFALGNSLCISQVLADMRGRKRSLRWGILLTLACIIVGSKLFGLYLQYIANYTALYAGLAGMMIAIVYLYGLSALLLYGAEFNTALAKARSESENDKIMTR